MLPGKKNVFDKKTIVVLRKARSLQEIGSALSRNINYQTKPKVERVRIYEKPDIIADNYTIIRFQTRCFNGDKNTQHIFKEV